MKTSILSPSGRLFVVGLVAMTVLAARLQAQYVSTIVSNGLNEPYGVTADPNENVYFTDSVNNRVAMYVPSTKVVTTLAGQPTAGTNNGTGANVKFSAPLGIVYARGGLVVVDQANQQLRYVSLAGAVSNLAGVTGVVGTNNGAALGSAQFSYPTGIAVANDGVTLYIADTGNNSIRVLNSNNVVSTLATSYLYNGTSHLFHSPAAVALDNNNNVWIADSYNQVICEVTNGTTQAYGIAGTYRVSGTNDSATASTAQFNLPSGLLWDPNLGILVISDSDNATIRSLTNSSSGYAVQTLAGLAGVPGDVDGPLSTAELRHPVGLSIDVVDTGYYFADWGNNALRVLQPTQPPPAPVAIANPALGYVIYAGATEDAQFVPFTQPVSVFNNAVNLSVEQNDGTVETYVTYGATGTTIPAPTTNSIYEKAFVYQINEGEPPPVPLLTGVGILPAMTIKAISIAPGRPSSQAVSAEIDFITANPTITGANSKAVTLTDVTSNAQIFYTLDGNPPTNGAADTFGPVLSGQTIAFNLTSNTTLSAQATAQNFAPSGVSTAFFSPTNFSADQITFGFESGEASSQFITAPGQTYIAPVTLSLIPSAEIMYTLQFSLAISNLGSAPAVPVTGANAFTFSSMLEKPKPGSSPPVYEPIPPAMVAGGLLLTNNNSYDLLEVGWLERPPATNLYDTTAQTLITYSQDHDTMFLNTGGQVVVGGFSFQVPTTATLGEQYEIQIANPSGTSDGISTAVYIVAPTNGSMSNGPISSVKFVTVGSARYLVGDVAPFYWFNAGDFGDSYLQDNDVTETFQTAIYQYNGTNVATQHSDYFDAMDSSDGSDNNYYLGTDTAINNIEYGDGVLAVDDVYVTFRRSLDPTLYWFDRYDTATGKVAVQVSNLLTQPFIAGAATPATRTASTAQPTHAPRTTPSTKAVPADQVASSGPRYITVAADQVLSGGNLSVAVPIRVLAPDTLPITVTMLRVEIDPLDGSPPISNEISFSANTNLGDYFDTASAAANDFGGAWLNSTSAGVSGTNLIGTLFVTLPSTVTSNSAYRVHFDHFSASPNGLALFHSTVQDGLITVGNRNSSSWNDGIPDSWRLLWFGTVSNSLSAATADPDGDGASNWMEYVAGTNPNDPTSVFKFGAGSTRGPSSFTLQWPSVVNKQYTIQTSYGISPASWTTIATNILGNGQTMQWTDSNATGKRQFYRAYVQ